jgi:putative MFS transporter
MAGMIDAAPKAPPGPKTPLSAHQKRLLAFLGVATFFEGYDFIALTQLLPEIRKSFDIGFSQGQNLVSLINIGTILAYFLVRTADRWGRRPVLSITIVGYAICSFASGFAPNYYVFAAAQLLARLFLIGEWSVSMVYASEEFPADRRGLAIGLIQGFSSLGSIFCVALVPLFFKLELFGLPREERWRLVYLAGGLPILVMAFLRRNLQESSRFAVVRDEAMRLSFGRYLVAFTDVLKTKHRNKIIKLSLLWFFSYLCMTNALVSWKEFMSAERADTLLAFAKPGELPADTIAKQVSRALTFASLFAMPMVFFVGKLLDLAGRRKGATIVYVLSIAGVFFSYTLSSYWPLVAAITFGIFAVNGFLTVLNTYNTELFPTEHRASAFAWSNNFLGRLGTLLGPVLVGIMTPTFGIGQSVAMTCVFAVLALVLLLLFLPETKGRELEETSES